MSLYKNILFATDLGKDSNYVCQVAQDLERVHNATLNIVHVIESVGTYGGGFYYIGDLNKQLTNEALTHLNQFSDIYGIEKQHQHLCQGNPKKSIITLAEELKSDLIVLGSHSAHGVGVLLGSTANYVLSHANCDVLTVPLKRAQIKDKK